MLDLYSLTVIAFFAVLFAVIYKKRKSVEIKYVLVMWRTKHFRGFIDAVAKKSPKLWKIIATIAVAVCFYYMIYGFYSLSQTAVKISLGELKQPGVAIILPTISSEGSAGPGYFLIPFWFWILIIALILIPHEFMHGVIARAEKVPLRSVGLLLLAIFPGAFVEPDEKKLKKRRLLTKLRIFSAGSFANFVVAAFILLLLSYVIWPVSLQKGIYLLNVTEGSPAALAGLKPNMIVTEMNQKPVVAEYSEYLATAGSSYLIEELGNATYNQTIVVRADNKFYDVTLGKRNETLYMGITYQPVYRIDPAMLFAITSFLTMAWIFSLAVGIINILPLYPLDGGLMVEALAQKYARRKAKQVTRTITAITLLLLLFIAFAPFLLV